MKKHYKGEKRGLPINNISAAALLLALLILFPLPAQVPINGFCDVSEYATDSGHTRVLSFDFNDDQFTDLFLFTPDNKSYTVFAGTSGGSYRFFGTFRFPAKITDFAPINTRQRGDKQFYFIDRTAQEMGIISFTTKATATILRTKKTDYPPGAVSSADIDQDGIPECCITGPGFDGISVFSYREGIIRKSRLINNKVYAAAIFSDIDNDGAPDIIAADPLSNSIDIFTNNTIGEFVFARSISIADQIVSLAAGTLNNDYYIDLIIGTVKGYQVFYNSAVGDFKTKVIIPTDYQPDKIIISDFNDDGISDLVYHNKKHRLVSLRFQLTEREYTEELIYFRDKPVSDIGTMSKRKKNTLLALNSEGILYEISRVSAYSDEASYMFGHSASQVAFFDYENDGIDDLAFVDEAQRVIGLVLRNSFGIPERFFSIPVVHNFSTIEIDDSDPLIKVFYCYSIDDRIVEVIRIDLYDFGYKRDFIYTDGILKSLRILPSAGTSNTAELLAAHMKGDNLIVSFFRYNGSRYIEERIPSVHRSILSAVITEDKSIYAFSMLDSSGAVSYIEGQKYKNNIRLQLFPELFPDSRFIPLTLFDEKEFFLFFIPGKEYSLLLRQGETMTFYLNRRMDLSNEIDRLMTAPQSGDENRKRFSILLMDKTVNWIIFDFRRNRISIKPVEEIPGGVTSFCHSIIDDFCYIAYTLENKPYIYLKKILCAL